MGSINNSRDGLNVLIVGAGIAGLGTATALAQKGHNVTVLEKHPCLNEFGASIGILANGVRCLRSWNLAPQFDQVVSKSDKMEIRDGNTGKYFGYLPMNIADWSRRCYGDENWNINRKDYQDLLADAAVAAGARIVFDVEIEKVDVDDVTIEYVADGGNGVRVKLEADVIIGADGMKSVVRRSIPATSHVEPVALIDEQAWRCTVPKDVMRSQGSEDLKALLKCGNEMMFTAPGKYVLCWPLPENRDYDVVCCLQKPGDIPVGRWGTKVDPQDAAQHFTDFCPVVRELLSHVNAAVKWTLAELPKLKTCRSDNGRVLLIGDAFHAMIPHSASGGNSAIEDAASIAECLDWAYRIDKSEKPNLVAYIAKATKAFEEIRKPRVERFQEASHEGYHFLGAGAEMWPMRNQMVEESRKKYDAAIAMSEEEWNAQPKPEASMTARFPTEPYNQWMYGYDTVAVTKERLATLV